jgi:hypothetical protein
MLKYDPSTGKFTWRERSEDFPSPLSAIRAFNTRSAGGPVYEEPHKGYRRMTLLGKRYKSHRVAWAMHHGDWPPETIDHINGVKDDNRIENLRAVTHIENCRNQKLHNTNTSGVMGVYWRPEARKWQVRIYVNGRLLHLGLYVKKDEAVAARKAAEEKYGFHANHGRPTLAKKHRLP